MSNDKELIDELNKTLRSKAVRSQAIKRLLYLCMKAQVQRMEPWMVREILHCSRATAYDYANAFNFIQKCSNLSRRQSKMTEEEIKSLAEDFKERKEAELRAALMKSSLWKGLIPCPFPKYTCKECPHRQVCHAYTQSRRTTEQP